jgi:3'-5' exoribonuclease
MTCSLDVLVKQADVKVTGTQKHFINAILEDTTGRIEAIQWGPSEYDIASWTNCEVVEVHGKCGTYKDKPQLTIDSVRGMRDDEIQWGHVLKSSVWDVAWMRETLEYHCNILEHGLGDLVRALVLTDDFLNKPAATFMHHAYVHGLAEHSLSVCLNSLRHANIANEFTLDTHVIVAGALLHDVGKVNEYTMTGKRLPASRDLVMQAAYSLDVDQEYLDRVRHVIASHHGRTEWGAVIEPNSREAWLVHAMDLADSRVFAMEKK